MNAKEMFEELGYKLADEAAYVKDKVIPYRLYEKNIILEFFVKEKRFVKAKGVIDSVAITDSELKAIIQQCKELGWLEEEPNQKSNFEYYKNEIKYAGYEFALVNGKPKMCRKSLCDQCYFNDKHFTCARKRIEWMLKPFKRKYKLTQFEYDLLQSYANGYKFKDINPLIVMKEKGYFKDVDKDEKITDILENCEAIE
jgi:hypothetical protein